MGETDGGGGALGRVNGRVGGSSSIARGGRDDASLGIGTGVTGAGGRELKVIPLRGRRVVISSSDVDREKTRGRADGAGNELAGAFAGGGAATCTTWRSPVLIISEGSSSRALRLVKGSTVSSSEWGLSVGNAPGEPAAFAIRYARKAGEFETSRGPGWKRHAALLASARALGVTRSRNGDVGRFEENAAGAVSDPSP
jgi:hypothetical protein